MSVEKWSDATLRKEKFEDPYTKLPNFVIQKFTRESIKYWVFLQSQYDGWNVNTQALGKLFGDGRDKAYRLMNDLIKYKLVERVRNLNGNLNAETELVVKNGEDFKEEFLNKPSEFNTPADILKTRTSESISRHPDFQYPENQELIKENKTKKENVLIRATKKNEIRVELPSFLTEDTWSEFLEYRKKIKRPITIYGQNLLLKKLIGFKELGYDIDQIIANTVESGKWPSFYIPHSNKTKGEFSHGKPNSNAANVFNTCKGALKGTSLDPDRNPTEGKSILDNPFLSYRSVIS